MAPCSSIGSLKSSSTISVRFIIPGEMFEGIVEFSNTDPSEEVACVIRRVSLAPPISSHRVTFTSFRRLESATSDTVAVISNVVPAITSTCSGLADTTYSVSIPIEPNRLPSNGST